MEGLLIAQVLAGIGELPQERGAWRFPDSRTFVLPIGERSLWILSSPPRPLIELKEGRSPQGERGSPFQLQLQARATGTLLSVSQVKLDRVVRLDFGPGEGFVSSPPVSLVLELTGRNCNLILLDERGTILGVQREVGEQDNRFRQLRAGLNYRPPPEYERPDPRQLGAAGLAGLLEGRSLADLRRVADGIGPELTATVSQLSGLPEKQELAAADLGAVEGALGRMLADPAGSRAEALGSGGLGKRRNDEEREALLVRLRAEALRRESLLERRMGDVERLADAATRAAALRQQGDLLLAMRPKAGPDGKGRIHDFDGVEVSLTLEPGLDAVQTATVLYERAKRHEQRHRSALTLLPGLAAELEEQRKLTAALESLPLTELRRLAREGGPARGQHRTQPGIRVTGPHGFEIVIGRNARDNDTVTFKIARSMDVWLHVQGYRGSHVIIRADRKQVPYDTILFAARLAAGHSQAAESENVAVDYTLRKNVWRPKGAAAGAVQFTGQKTVFVTPLKDASQQQP